jgi:hypothetical protein
MGGHEKVVLKAGRQLHDMGHLLGNGRGQGLVAGQHRFYMARGGRRINSRGQRGQLA